MKLIIGLGNPGKEYEHTRHNVGFMVVDTIAQSEKFTSHKKMQAEVLKTTVDEKRVILAKPQTYMNSSGQSVRGLLDFYKLTAADLIVVHDDKDIPLGETRVQKNRGAAGHNGIKSIIEHLGTQDFLRIRVGVAPVDKKIEDTADFVLGNFSKEEMKLLQGVTEHVVQEITSLLRS